MENYKEQYTNNKRRQRIEIDVYVLAYMLVTLDTAQFERSLLNADAQANAVQIIQEQEYNNGKTKRQRTKTTKGRRKLEIIY